jgi:DNA invertase Pin-like site-specific DNA recombinase
MIPSEIDRPHQITSKHLEKKAIVYVRQSSSTQVKQNTGSSADQRSLADIARNWGWPGSRILTIDHDLGRSGTSSEARTGFKDMLELIDRGEVGIVFVRDVSRLSREPLDSEIFLNKAIRAGVLIEANGKVYDGAVEDLAELFAIRIQQLLAWHENRSRVLTLGAAKIAKVRQGQAVTRPPIGYVEATRGKWILDPDPKVQEVVRRVFTAYLELGSLGKVMKYFRQTRSEFPTRIRGELTLAPVRRTRLEQIIRNPAYTGDYVFRRFKITSAAGGRPRKTQVRRPDEWVKIENHHPAYVTREEWKAIETVRVANRPSVRPHVGKGPALLQGVTRCGECDRWMKIHYCGRNAHGLIGSYLCRQLDPWGKPLHSVSASVRLVDDVIVRHVLNLLNPVEVQTAATVLAEASAEEQSLKRAGKRKLREAEDSVDEIRRRYLTVDARNDLVRVDLETRLNEALARLDELRREESSNSQIAPGITASEIDEVVSLSKDIEALWEAPTTTNEDRKRLLRAVISGVVVEDAKSDVVELTVIWTGGLREKVNALRPAGVDALVRELRGLGMSAESIAERLRAAGIKTLQWKPMSRGAMHQKLARLGLNWKSGWMRILRRISELMKEGLSCRLIVETMMQEAPQNGPWYYGRVHKLMRRLQKGVPGIDLPAVLPIERERQEIIDRIRAARAEGRLYPAIAEDLNAAGYRPRKARLFSAQQARDLLREWDKRERRARGA